MRVSTPLLQVALDVFGLLLSLLSKEIEKRNSAAVNLGFDHSDTLTPIVRQLALLRDDLKAHL